MPMPQRGSIQIYLLHEIERRGGRVRANAPFFEAIANYFPDFTQQERQLINMASGTNKWENRVNWARYDLVRSGELDGSERGVWRITQKGRERLQNEWPPRESPQYSTRLYIDRPRARSSRKADMSSAPYRPSLPASELPGAAQSISAAPSTLKPSTQVSAQISPVRPVSDAETSIRQQILAKLNSMNDRQFEVFVGHLLAELGYENV